MPPGDGSTHFPNCISQGGHTYPPEDGCACVTMPHRWGWSEGAKPRCVCRTICGRFGRSGRSPAEVVLPPVRATSAASPAPDGPPRFSPQPRAPQVISPTQGRRTDMHTHTHTFHYISKVRGGTDTPPQKMAGPISQTTFQKSQGGRTCPPEMALPISQTAFHRGDTHTPQKMAALV